MDITRNWRLKTSRSQLIATRCPETGVVILPQQNGVAPKNVDLYTFEAYQPAVAEGRADFAKACRTRRAETGARAPDAARPSDEGSSPASAREWAQRR